VFPYRSLLAACLFQIAVMHDTKPRFAIKKHTVEIPHPRYSVNCATATYGQAHEWMNRLHTIPNLKMRYRLHELLLAGSMCAKRSPSIVERDLGTVRVNIGDQTQKSAIWTRAWW